MDGFGILGAIKKIIDLVFLTKDRKRARYKNVAAELDKS